MALWEEEVVEVSGGRVRMTRRLERTWKKQTLSNVLLVYNSLQNLSRVTWYLATLSLLYINSLSSLMNISSIPVLLSCVFPGAEWPAGEALQLSSPEGGCGHET